MPTKNPRITITVDDATDKMLEDYQYSGRHKNRTQAILSLIYKGLDSELRDVPTPGEKAPAPTGRELTEKDQQIVAMLPFTPESVKDGILTILDATVDLAAASESLRGNSELVHQRVQHADAETTDERIG